MFVMRKLFNIFMNLSSYRYYVRLVRLFTIFLGSFCIFFIPQCIWWYICLLIIILEWFRWLIWWCPWENWHTQMLMLPITCGCWYFPLSGQHSRKRSKSCLLNLWSLCCQRTTTVSSVTSDRMWFRLCWRVCHLVSHSLRFPVSWSSSWEKLTMLGILQFLFWRAM